MRVTVGKRGLAEGALELKRRGDKETTMVPEEDDRRRAGGAGARVSGGVQAADASG